MNYNDLDKEQRKQVRDETGYSHKSLEMEDPQLIDNHKFEDYAYDFAREIYDISDSWPFTCIDWSDQQMNYATTL